jgi:hypothetical protein
MSNCSSPVIMCDDGERHNKKLSIIIIIILDFFLIKV